MIKKYKSLNMILKIIIGIMGLIVWPISLFLLSIDSLIYGYKNKKIANLIIGLFGTTFFGIAFANIEPNEDVKVEEELTNSNATEKIEKKEFSVENVQSALIENGFDIKEVYLATLDNDRLAIHVYSDTSTRILYEKGLDIIKFVESNFDVNNGYWIAGYTKAGTFLGSFRIDNENISPELTSKDLKEVSHSQNGILDPEYEI